MSNRHPDEIYMRRALQLAKLGYGFVSPNPMVGAVITDASGTIIGEGWHRRFGEGHAEVNAVASVRDRESLREATIYVTLEPCSHYGKTPPCAKLLIECGFKRVVIGCLDPFPEVAGRGVRMLREAGIDVVTGVLERECHDLNRRFITAHTSGRPYILLKWAQSADGFMAMLSEQGEPKPVRLSTSLTETLMHRERAGVDAILVGPATADIDSPRLDTRLWPARKSPLRVTFAHRDGSVPKGFDPHSDIILDPSVALKENMETLYSEHKVTSLMVEGGPTTLNLFIDAGLVDETRVEIAPVRLSGGLKAPRFSGGLADRDFPEEVTLLRWLKNSKND